MSPTINTLFETINVNQEKTKLEILEVYQIVDKVYKKIVDLEQVIVGNVKIEQSENEGYCWTSSSDMKIKKEVNSFVEQCISSDDTYTNQSSAPIDSKACIGMSLNLHNITTYNSKEPNYEPKLNVLSTPTKGIVSEFEVQINNSRDKELPETKKSNPNMNDSQNLSKNVNFMEFGWVLSDTRNLSNQSTVLKTEINCLSCTYCSYTTSHGSNLDCHVETVHNKNPRFNCDLCKFSCFGKSRLVSHMENTHCKMIWSCEKCDYF